jgi:hypothetical protein
MIGDQITIEELLDDPYPVYKQLRDNEPVSFVKPLKRWLVTWWEDCKYIEQHPEIFTPREKHSTMNRAFGLSMLRTDGDEHRRLRRAVEGFLRPKAVRDLWNERIEQDVEDLIERNYDRGEMDLVTDFSGPLAARVIKHLLSMEQASDQDMMRWSQAFIDGIANESDSQEVWDRVAEANRGVDEILEFEIKKLEKQPNQTVLSSMVQAGLTMDEIKANAKLIISGGLNEPRDGLSSAVRALLTHPEQLKLVRQDPSLYKNVTEEILRWQSPIGMYVRETTCDTTLRGVELPKGTKIFVGIGSANRDERMWPDGETFNITRDHVQTHMAFSAGSHYCVGAWVARSELTLSVPRLFEKLPNLHLDETRPPKLWGFVFRGPITLHVRWDV